MSDQQQSIPIYQPYSESQAKGRLSGSLMYTLSIMLHGVLLLAMMFVQNINVVNTLPPAVRVDLVSFSSAPSKAFSSADPSTEPIPSDTLESEPLFDASEAPLPEIDTAMASEIETAAEAEMEALGMDERAPESLFDSEMTMSLPKQLQPEESFPDPTVKEPEQKKEVVEKPVENKTKKSLKKKTFDADKAKQIEQKTLEKKKKIPTKQPVRNVKKEELKIKDALARMKNRVESRQTDEVSGEASASEGAVGGRIGGRASSQPIELYSLALTYRIRQNWSFNEKLAGNEKNLEAVIVMKVLKNGRIIDAWFETRSGNTYLDDSAMKAVKKSDPLPPLPPGYSSYDVGLKFTPSGLQ